MLDQDERGRETTAKIRKRPLKNTNTPRHSLLLITAVHQLNLHHRLLPLPLPVVLVLIHRIIVIVLRQVDGILLGTGLTGSGTGGVDSRAEVDSREVGRVEGRSWVLEREEDEEE